MDCIFCKIVSGEIPSKKISETPNSLALLDAFPLTTGHCLVIPKKHYEKIQEMTPEDNSDLFETVRKITAKVDSITNSTLIAVHNGKESGQEIPHVHVHLIPRSKSDGAGAVHSMFKNQIKLTNDEIDELQNRLTTS